LVHHWTTSSFRQAACTAFDALPVRPSIVVTLAEPTEEIGVMHDRVGVPSICTVQAPHSPAPQPNFVPVICITSRSAQSNGMSGSASTERTLPLTVKVIIGDAPDFAAMDSAAAAGRNAAAGMPVVRAERYFQAVNNVPSGRNPL
jgi:hypothetical protein